MATGNWDPQSGTAAAGVKLDELLLRRFIAIAKAGELDSLATQLSAEDQQRWELMQVPAKAWEQAATAFSEAELKLLMQFLTIAEMQLPGWHGGVKSPVIALNKVLKQRGHKLDKALLQWIRENSDNRYLPNGPVG